MNTQSRKLRLIGKPRKLKELAQVTFEHFVTNLENPKPSSIYDHETVEWKHVQIENNKDGWVQVRLLPFTDCEPDKAIILIPALPMNVIATVLKKNLRT